MRQRYVAGAIRGRKPHRPEVWMRWLWGTFKGFVLWGFDIALWVGLVWLLLGRQLSAWTPNVVRVETWRQPGTTLETCQRVTLGAAKRAHLQRGMTVRYLGLEVGSVQQVYPDWDSGRVAVVWCRDPGMPMLPLDHRALMGNVTLLGGESLEFLPTSRARYITPTDVVTPDPKGEHWDSFRMSDYMTLQLETLHATEDSLTGIEQGLMYLALHQQQLRAALSGVQASGEISKQVIQQLQALDGVAQDLRDRSQGVVSLAKALEQSQQQLPSPGQLRQSLNQLNQPLDQVSAKVTSLETSTQLRKLSNQLQQIVQTINRTTHRWGVPPPQAPLCPSGETMPSNKVPLCQD